MTYEAYQRRRSELRAARPELVDLGELDVYRSLGPSFAPIEPSTDAQAQHRCHLAERFLDRLGLAPSLQPRPLVTHGVRRSLAALFSTFRSLGERVAIPRDVYPTYLSLAERAGLVPTTYEARRGLPAPAALSAIDVLLVCSPLKPWGGDGEILRAIEWARDDRRRVLVVDGVYATPPSPEILAAASCGGLVLLTSLSKGWLAPEHVGLCLVPESLTSKTREAFAALEKDVAKLRVGFEALTGERTRPERVAALLRDRADRLDALTRSRPELGAQACEGYFAVSTRSADELLSLGVIATPGDVFGGPASMSVLSSLAPAPRR